jgi:hypothetical protein
MHIRRISYGFTLIASLVLADNCLGGTVFDFQSTILAPNHSGFYQDVSASGTLTTANYDPGLGGYPVVDISGTRTVTVYDGLGSSTTIQEQITGLLPVGGFSNSNVLYYPGPPFLDFFGLGFTVDNALYSDDGFGDVNLYFDPGTGKYTEPYYAVYLGDFSATPVVSSAANPEPSTALLVIGALLIVRKWRGSLGGTR